MNKKWMGEWWQKSYKKKNSPVTKIFGSVTVIFWKNVCSVLFCLQWRMCFGLTEWSGTVCVWNHYPICQSADETLCIWPNAFWWVRSIQTPTIHSDKSSQQQSTQWLCQNCYLFYGRKIEWKFLNFNLQMASTHLKGRSWKYSKCKNAIFRQFSVISAKMRCHSHLW